MSASAPIISMVFNRFLEAAWKAKKVTPFQGVLVALDPGETTGYSVWVGTLQGAELLEQGQLKTWPMQSCVEEMSRLIDRWKPTHLVHETYAVYEWKTDSHAWSQVPTLRIIGCIETLCIQHKIPFSDQTAQVAKNWCTDEKLKGWGFYAAGLRHARDSVRHGAYFLIFRPDRSEK